MFTIGKTRERLVKELSVEFKVEATHTLDQLLVMVEEQQLVGNLVFSPAHPSFEQFKSYVDRETRFKQKVRAAL